jgi:hypothetical protein
VLYLPAFLESPRRGCGEASLIRFLVAAILAEIAVAGAVLMLALSLNVYDAAYWRYEAIAAKHERAEIERRHKQLITQIHKEGLWRRLGMPGQPWLH